MKTAIELSKAQQEQLLQIFNGAIWDGNLIGKAYRDELVRLGFVDRAHGYNFITGNGIGYLLESNLAHF